MHLDLRVEGEEALVAEVGRLINLGAQQVGWTYPDEAAFVVLAGTEGNLFCVVNVGAARRSPNEITRRTTVLGCFREALR